jgi:hypothetical protein
VEPKALLVGWLWIVFVFSFTLCVLAVCLLPVGNPEPKFTALGTLIPISAVSGGLLAVVEAVGIAGRSIVDALEAQPAATAEAIRRAASAKTKERAAADEPHPWMPVSDPAAAAARRAAMAIKE